MAKGQLFKYAVLKHPRVVKDLAGNETQADTSIIVPEVQVTAANVSVVQMIAARKIPYDVEITEEIEIIVRPF